jgi:hypothetical protein
MRRRDCGDITQKWAQQLREWITEVDSILTDLDGLLPILSSPRKFDGVLTWDISLVFTSWLN